MTGWLWYAYYYFLVCHFLSSNFQYSFSFEEYSNILDVGSRVLQWFPRLIYVLSGEIIQLEVFVTMFSRELLQAIFQGEIIEQGKTYDAADGILSTFSDG